MTHAKIQHYVPQFLLRRFETSAGSNQLWAFDKRRERSFLAAVRNVGAEKRFYDLVVGDLVLTLEPGLSDLEAAAAVVLARIIEGGEIGRLSHEERTTISQFVVVQFFRTRHFRESVAALGRLVAQALAEDDPTAPERLGLTAPTGPQVKAQALSHLESSLSYAPLIASKAWALYEAPRDTQFFISDHPVVMANSSYQSDIRGTIGLAVLGIEVYLPLSPRYCLGFICPSVRERFAQRYSGALAAREAGEAEDPDYEAIAAAHDGFEYGLSIPLASTNVDYINSLEALWAERFVFAAAEDFALVRQLLASNPDARHGPRPAIS